MKEYKKIALFLACIALLKVASAFLGDNYISLRDFFASVLNTENVVSLTNDARKSVGLRELKISPKLESAAQKKAEDMLKNQYFSHVSPSDRMAWDFMSDVKYKYLFAGENLAMNFNSAEDVTQGWLTSVTHRENILDKNYTQIGVGVATGKFLGANTIVVVQMFGKPLRSGAKVSKKLAVRSKGKPVVKRISVKNYIAELQNNSLAEWTPFAKMHQVYAFNDNMISTKTMLDIFLLYIASCGIGIFIYRKALARH